MRRAVSAHAKGSSFSLVELVIVVVIIGVIAAIAIPRISSGVAATGESALKSNLAVLRRAIDLYAAEHGGVYPGARADGAGGAANTSQALESQLTKFSDEQGNVSATGSATYRFGPYLRRIPPQPVGDNANNSTVAIDSVNSPPLVTAGTEGWVYNPTTGEMIANTDDPNQDGSHTFDEY